MNAGKHLTGIAVAAASFALAAPASASVLKVNTAADANANDGKCSLREAIQATNINQSVNGTDDCKHVNGDTGPDLINLPDKPYPVNGAAGDDNNASGDLDIEAGKRLTIRGDGVPTLAGNLDRVVHLESGRLTLENMGITDGDAGTGRGGGILVDGGKLTLRRARVVANNAYQGAGIAVNDLSADLILARAKVQGNLADGPNLSHGGGGIQFIGRSARIERSTISGNTTQAGEGGGIYVDRQEGSFAISGSVVSGNHANARAGGGIMYDPFQGAKIALVRALVSQNTARFTGGGIWVANEDATATIRSSAINLNSLSSTSNEFIGGAGISNRGTLRLTDAVVSGNSSLSPNGLALHLGAGLRNDGPDTKLIGRGVLVTGNTMPSGSGAGIFSEDPLELTNATISANSAGTGLGGGLYQVGDPISLSHVTFASNDAGGDDAISGDPDEVTLHASIIDNGTGACDDSVLSTGQNVDAGTSCGLGENGDIDGTSPKLKALANNGGRSSDRRGRPSPRSPTRSRSRAPRSTGCR
jgi:fibronectin-binding autotransporter adhesin